MTILKVSGLRKSYGSMEVVKGLDFEVHENEVFALIGPNGAGKTTTLRICATILTPGAGRIEIDGVDALTQPALVRKRISYLPEESGAYKTMRGRDFLRFVASLYEDDRAAIDAAVARGAEISGLGERLDDRLGSYSKGMTRKLLLARSVMTRPRLAILDEPTSGLDVMNALDIRDRIKAMAHEGMSVLLSSHNMLEIEFLSDRVALVDEGVIKDTGTPEELKRRHGASNLEEVFGKIARPDSHIRGLGTAGGEGGGHRS